MLTKDCVQYLDFINDWQEAVRMVGEPLVKNNIVEERYVDAMINTVKELGSYIVIAPNIALPHASPDSGALKTGLSILKLKNPVCFDQDAEAKASVLIAIACADNSTHMKMLQALVEVLMDEEKMNVLLETNDVEIIYDLFKNVEVSN